MKKLLTKWQMLLYPVLIILLTSFLAFTNYEPGTFLSGWDTLHPEFNFQLYLKRAFFGAWQEHQGLGAVASQAHAAELPRLILLYVLNLFLPLQDVRYAFFFLALGVGAFGVFYFAKYLLEREKTRFVGEASFIASVFYVLNLTTVQQFYVPLEMFAVHFAVLPWLFYLATRYLRENSRKVLVWFSAASLLGASMAHTATLFYVYVASLTLYIFSVVFIKRRKLQLKRGLVLIIVTLLLNSFWILPNLYFIKNHASEVANSKIHRIFSDEAFLQGKSFGSLEDLALQRNFLFNWREFGVEEGEFVNLLDEWKGHLERPYVKEIGFLVFSLAILGIAVSMGSVSSYVLALLPLFGLAVFFWINANPPFEAIFNYLRNNSNLFKEGLRFPFTKFSILLVFTLATYLSFTSQRIMEKLSKAKLGFLYFGLVLFSMVYFALPSFKGGLISPSMRVSIPGEYFRMFSYFEEKDASKRVAKLPLHTFWGWNFYSWNYQGAGFTWFGVPQPTLDREFDRWSRFNESFYNQASFALHEENPGAFEKTLEKYKVSYLLLDESVINAGGNSDLLYGQEAKNLFRQSEHINLDQEFGFLEVYKTDFEVGESFIFTPDTYITADVDTTYAQEDPVYREFGTYVEDKEGIGFPFANFDLRKAPEVLIEDNAVRILSEPLSFFGSKKIDFGEEVGVTTFVNEEKKVEVSYEPEVRIVESFEEGRGFSETYNCDIEKKGEVSKEKLSEGVIYKASNGGVACDFYNYPDLLYNQGYVLNIKGENLEGRPLKIYLQNQKTGRMDLEVLLPEGRFDQNLFILPKQIEGSGYTVNLESRSFGDVSSSNYIEKIEIVSAPIDYLKSIKLVPEVFSLIENDIQIEKVQKIGASHFLVESRGSGLVVLGQGYEDGWRAYLIEKDSWFSVKKFLPFIFGSELDHVKVDSWANGWYFGPDSEMVVITFWPQYLQYAGFIILAITLYAVMRKNKRVSRKNKLTPHKEY